MRLNYNIYFLGMSEKRVCNSQENYSLVYLASSASAALPAICKRFPMALHFGFEAQPMAARLKDLSEPCVFWSFIRLLSLFENTPFPQSAVYGRLSSFQRVSTHCWFELMERAPDLFCTPTSCPDASLMVLHGVAAPVCLCQVAHSYGRYAGAFLRTPETN